MVVIATHIKNGETLEVIYDNLSVVKTSVSLKHRYTRRNKDKFLMGYYLNCIPTGLNIPVPTDKEEIILSLSDKINKFINDNERREFLYTIDEFKELHTLELTFKK